MRSSQVKLAKKSTLHDGQVDCFAIHGEMQSTWKQCKQSRCITRSARSNSAKQSEHSATSSSCEPAVVLSRLPGLYEDTGNDSRQACKSDSRCACASIVSSSAPSKTCGEEVARPTP